MWCGLGKLFLAGSLRFICAVRPCTDDDWRFDFGTCKDGHRNVFMYPATSEGAQTVCDPDVAGSWPSHVLPPLNLSCAHSCHSGSHASVELQHVGEEDTGAVMEPVCKACPAGKFSLGGGLLVSGVAGDWRQRWPVELQSNCAWKTFYGTWKFASELHSGPTLHVSSPTTVAGLYSLADASWNAELPAYQQTRLVAMGRLERAPGSGIGCAPFQLQASSNTQIILLLLPGGCSPRQKTIHAANAGARAVLLMSEGYQRSPRIPGVGPGDVGSTPHIPLFGISRETGEIFMVAMNRSVVHVNITSRAGDDSQQVGCSPWIPDPSGRFVSSGDNRNYHEIISFLSLNVHLVRPGHIIFRYSVSAEKDFDGLTFDIDWNEVLSLTSDQAEYKEFKMNISAGPHLLRWKYSKDFQDSAGRDTAWLQLIELTGTSYADFECRPCHSARTHSGAGASHCNLCGQDEYLGEDADAHDNLRKCTPCPTGRWSRPGSSGLDSCKLRLPCTQKDVVTSYTSCENSERYKRQSWRVPLTCDTTGLDSLLGTTMEKVSCAACQPHEHRPHGTNCEPRTMTCPPELHAVRELVVSRWDSWPSNFSTEVWVLNDDRWVTKSLSDESDNDDDAGQQWSLASSASFAYIGNNTDGPKSGASDLGRRFGDAILHFDVDLFDSGNMTFFAEVFPLEAWGNQARLLIDNLLATELQILETRNNFLHAMVPLKSGKHQLTWVWEYHEVQEGIAAGELHGMRLWNVTVLNAVGSGASRCAPCPPGNEVVSHGSGCWACQPGQFLDAAVSRCQICPANNFSAFYGSTSCRSCGSGLWSNPGSSRCWPMDTVQAYLGNGAPVPSSLLQTRSEDGLKTYNFNVTKILLAWRAASGGVTGPFAIGGRQFLIGLFDLVPVPGLQDSGVAYAWELLMASGNTECAKSAQDYDSLGNVVANVSAVMMGSARGVSVTFVEGEHCENSGNLRALTIFFSCAMRTSPDPSARKDALGLYHMPQLTVTSGIAGQCENITLEWPTSAACSKCTKDDYTEKVGACGADGSRIVSFVQTGKCLGGEPLPGDRQEQCGDSVEDVNHAKIILAILVPCAIVLAVSCCCYAFYLHRKYAKFVQDL